MWLKNTLFSILVVTVFFAGAELILALAGVHPALDSEDPFVGFAESVPLFVEETLADGSVRVKTAHNKLGLFNYQQFPRAKNAATYRVFCVGGSTTFGRPYDDTVSFCGWLRAYLKAADPARNWEIINAGGVSYASYRVTKLMTELVQYQPDLFIVYTGQNEFLERRSYGRLADLPSWLINLNARLSGTRIYTALSTAINSLKPGLSLSQARQRYQLGGEVDTVLDHTIGPQSYHRDDDLRDHIMRHFRLNLERMARIARQAGAGILFIKPAINLKDMSPFKSEHRAGLSEQQLADWQALYRHAAELEHDGQPQQALAACRQALAIDDRYAELHYSIGRLLFSLGNHDAALSALRRAVAEDIAPLRILEPMQQAVVDAAAEAAAPLVDFEAILGKADQTQYGHSVPGKEYFVDHVHTNKEGYRLLGLALFDTLVQRGIASTDDSWNPARIDAVRQAVLEKFLPVDEGHALVKLARVLAWAGKFAEAYDLFGQALVILGPRPELYDQMARCAFFTGDSDSTIRLLYQQLEHFPYQSETHAKLAALEAERHNTDIALEHCQAELLTNPANPKVLGMLGELHEDKGNDELARENYERALKHDPEQLRTRLKLALLLSKQGRYDAALSTVLTALKDVPDDQEVHSALGDIYLRQGNYTQAERHFQEVLRLQPGDVNALGKLQQLQSGHREGDMASNTSRNRCASTQSGPHDCPAGTL